MASQQTSTQAPEEQVANNSKSGAIVRYAIVAILVVFFLKPYFVKEKEAPLAAQTFRIAGSTMGTTWEAAVAASPSYIVELNSKGTEDAENVEASTEPKVRSCEDFLANVVQKRLDRIDAIASTYKYDSEISKFNRSESTEWFEVSKELASIAQTALDVAQITGGAFDPTVAPIVNMYRFGPDKSPLAELPTDDAVAQAMTNVGYDKLEVRLEPTPALRKKTPGLTVDFSGVAKGAAVDFVGEAFESLGLNDYMIEVGGEIRVKGKKVDAFDGTSSLWTLGVQTPEKTAPNSAPDTLRAVRFPAEVTGALATSGDYNNYLQVGSVRFSHIVDPRSGKPTEIIDAKSEESDEKLGSVTIVSLDCAKFSCGKIDALATAFYVLGEKDGLALADKLGLPVLYVFREKDQTFREAPSKAFAEKVDSSKFD